MSKIGDLFVRLGLKKEEFSKGISEAKKESSSFAESVKGIGLKGKIAFAAVAAAVTGVVAAVKNLAKSNQTLGDEFNRTTAGMTAMWDTLKSAIASTDFSNFLSDLQEANRLARDLYDAQDALSEINTSYNISLAKQLETINNLKVRLRDVNLSEQERKAAGEQLLQIYKDLEANPTRGMNAFSEASLNKMANKLGWVTKNATDKEMAYARKQVEEFFVWLGSEQGSKMNSLYNKAALVDQHEFWKNGEWQNQADQIATAQGVSKAYQQMLRNYNNKVSDKERLAMEQAVTGAYQQQAKYSGETLRIQTLINNLKGSGGRSGGGNSEINQIEKIQESTLTQRELLQKRYAEQLALLQKYGQDASALTQKFSNDLVNSLSDKAAEGDIFERTMGRKELLQKHYEELLEVFRQYNMDSSSLGVQYVQMLAQIREDEEAETEKQKKVMDEWSKSVVDAFLKINSVDLDDVQEALADFNADLDAQIEKSNKSLQRAEDMIGDFKKAVVSGFSEACQEMADQLFGLKDTNVGSVVKALLTPLAQMAIKMGEIIVAEGIAMEAAKSALSNPYTAIAAGAALIAIGAAATAALNAVAQSAGRSSTTTSYGRGSNTGGSGSYTENIETELTIYVKGRISGSDIVISGERTVNKWSR